jgi:hypothetical protein
MTPTQAEAIRSVIGLLAEGEYHLSKPGESHFVMTLWTAEEGRSDLGLELTLVETSLRLVAAQIDDIRVLLPVPDSRIESRRDANRARVHGYRSAVRKPRSDS